VLALDSSVHIASRRGLGTPTELSAIEQAPGHAGFDPQVLSEALASAPARGEPA